jgi:hypothetical protein
MSPRSRISPDAACLPDAALDTVSANTTKSSIEGIEVTRAAILPIFVAAIAAAQQDTPLPTFRAGTKLVEVDVVARSKGAPVTVPLSRR